MTKACRADHWPCLRPLRATEQTKYVWIIGVTVLMLLAAYVVHVLAERLPARHIKAFFNATVAWPVNRLSDWLGRAATMVRIKTIGLPDADHQPPA